MRHPLTRTTRSEWHGPHPVLTQAAASALAALLLLFGVGLWAQQPAPPPAQAAPQAPVKAKPQPAASQTQSPAKIQYEAERSAAAANQPKPREFTAEQRAKVEKTINAFMSAAHAPGVSAAVVVDNKPVWSAGFGMADLENQVPTTSSTLYRLGSISKSLTAVAVMQLWERGQLDLDAPVQKYCAAFPEKAAPITSRELLAHLSGIRHYRPDGKGDVPDDSARHFRDIAEALQLFAADPLIDKPGTHFHYSTYGYTVLGCVVEGATHQKFVDVIAANVFRPAGMEHTQADDDFAIVLHRTRWYHKTKNGTVVNAGVLDSSYKIPGGGLLSSAADMADFEAAILTDKLVKRSTRDVMWTIPVPTEQKPSHYALGWFITDKFGVHLAGHTGGQQGTDTTFLIAPDRNAGVVVLANMDDADTTPLAEKILQIVLGL
jgi:serine beta-lactamase-like protein LACTB, mitochondrial